MKTSLNTGAALQQVRASWSTHRDRWLLLAAAAALVVCLLNPGWPTERDRFAHVVVFDITQSMNVQDQVLDGKPASRLAFAKQALRQALLRLPCGSKLGFGAFTEHRSFLLLEPVEVCANLGELRTTLGHIDGRMAWSGNSEIAKGLHSGIDIARLLPGNPSLVFITDGHEAPPLSPLHRPAFDDKPQAVVGLLAGVGDLRPSPIPKSDPSGRPLGFWQADQVAQTDPYRSGRGSSVSGESMSEDEAAKPAAGLGATPGSEHLSALREPYLRLLASEQGLAYQRLDTTAALSDALMLPALAKPAPVRADGRTGCALLALLLLLWRYVRPLARRRQGGPVLRMAAVGLVLASALTGPGARANDRPFQVARTAVLEDDEYVWSFESWVQRLGSVRGLSVEPEYSFAAGTSVQVELTRRVDRRGSDTGHEAEIEFKQVINDIARDGWGLGLSAALSAERTRESGSTVPSVGIRLPLSLALGQSGAVLHLNLGISKARDERRAFNGAVAIEREVYNRTLLFAELAREDRATFAHLGARHWLRRERLAIDFSLQQQRAGGHKAVGFIIGLGWYDF